MSRNAILKDRRLPCRAPCALACDGRRDCQNFVYAAVMVVIGWQDARTVACPDM